MSIVKKIAIVVSVAVAIFIIVAILFEMHLTNCTKDTFILIPLLTYVICMLITILAVRVGLHFSTIPKMISAINMVSGNIMMSMAIVTASFGTIKKMAS